MKKSYQDLLKVFIILSDEIEYVFNNYGIELRLLCYGDSVSILRKDKEFFIKNFKNKIIDIFNIVYYYPDDNYEKYNLNILFDIDNKKIIDLSKYFKTITSVMNEEFCFSSRVFDLFDDSINDICFDIFGRAFLEARALVMNYDKLDDNYLKNNIKMFELYDYYGRKLCNDNILSKTKK